MVYRFIDSDARVLPIDVAVPPLRFRRLVVSYDVTVSRVRREGGGLTRPSHSLAQVVPLDNPRV